MGYFKPVTKKDLDSPCKHPYPPNTWMLIRGNKVCSECFTNHKLGQLSVTASIYLNSHPHR